jgi:23S rRNA pseudouridine955/2504/2580 synthase
VSDGTATAGVQIVEVAADDADIRLDRWFRRHYPQITHGRLEKLLRTGQVRIDGQRAKASARLDAGQKIRVPPLGAAETVARRPRTPSPDAHAVEALRRCILHRDDDVIVLNKPPGLATQGGSGVRESVDAMLEGLRFGAADRPRLVHRLDKDTSGILLLGRSARATARLAEAFRGRDAVKTYWALVVGVPKPPRGRIDVDLAKRYTGGGRERAVAVGRDDEAGGLRAITDYAVVEAAGRRCAWLALRPHTGRTHQIRVHCADALGTPILGDGKYGGAGAFVAGVPGGRRLHLHARAIALPHPAGGTLRVVAPLPPVLAATWDFFGFSPTEAPDPFA